MINTEDYISSYIYRKGTKVQERQADRQTGRKTDRQTDRQTDRGTDGNRQAGRQREVQFGVNDAIMTDNHLWIQV